LLSAGLEIEAFVDSELVDPGYDFLREARLCLVLYSRHSVLTESVRLSNRLRQSPAESRILIELKWEPNPQAALVFEGFPSERIAFDHELAFRRVSDLVKGAEDDADDGYESLGKRPVRRRKAEAPPDRLSESLSAGFDVGSASEALDQAAPAKARSSRPPKSLRKILAGESDRAIVAPGATAKDRHPSLRRILRDKG
jgi:hypothetical protein